MSREIRKVPADWKHPMDDKGRYIPLHDDMFEAACNEWDEDNARWEAGTHPDIEVAREEYLCHRFEDWDGARPVREDYADYQGKPRTHLQAYETVSEGTPVSPVFATEDELIDWIAENGLCGVHGGTWPRESAERFVKGSKWMPSGMLVKGKGMLTGPELADEYNHEGQ